MHLPEWKLLGDAGTDRLGRAKIVVFGLGGAGSYAAEALARCGVASLTLVDNGTISADHINRQLYALRSTIGRSNVEIAKARIRDIDEGILVHTYDTFYNEETPAYLNWAVMITLWMPWIQLIRNFF